MMHILVLQRPFSESQSTARNRILYARQCPTIHGLPEFALRNRLPVAGDYILPIQLLRPQHLDLLPLLYVSHPVRVVPMASSLFNLLSSFRCCCISAFSP